MAVGKRFHSETVQRNATDRTIQHSNTLLILRKEIHLGERRTSVQSLPVGIFSHFCTFCDQHVASLGVPLEEILVIWCSHFVLRTSHCTFWSFPLSSVLLPTNLHRAFAGVKDMLKYLYTV